jgi:hypothetical protein
VTSHHLELNFQLPQADNPKLTVLAQLIRHKCTAHILYITNISDDKNNFFLEIYDFTDHN